MSTCSSLDISDRIHIAYGSIISASLSIIGTICTIILIKIRNKKNLNDPSRKQLLSRSKSNNNNLSANSIISINSGSGGYSYFQEELNDNSNKNFNQFINNLKYNNSNSNSKNSFNSNNSKGSQKTKISHFIINLSIADLLASVFILISNIMMIHFNETYIKAPFSSDSHSIINMMSICTLGNGFISFSYISTFFWTLGIALYIHQQFSLTSLLSSSSISSTSFIKQSTRNNKIIKIFFYLVNWVIPFLLGGIIISGSKIQDRFTTDSSASTYNDSESSNGASIANKDTLPWCSIDSNVQLAAFYLPLMVSMTFTLFYTLLIRSRFSNGNNSFLNNSSSSSSLSNGGSGISLTPSTSLNSISTSSLSFIKLQNKIIGRLVLFCIVFFICWTPKLVSFFISYFSNHVTKQHECKQLLWLEVLSATLFPLQGFLNFLSYTVFKKFKEFIKFKFNNLLKSLNFNNSSNNSDNSNNFSSNLFFTNKSSTTTTSAKTLNNNNFYFTFSTFDLDKNQNK